MTKTIFIEHFLCVRHYCKRSLFLTHFILTPTLWGNSYSNCHHRYLFHIYGNRGIERLHNVPKVAQLGSIRAKIRTQ